MRPSILDDYGLESALRRYVEETARTTSLQLVYKQIPPEGFGRLPSWLEVTLYRIAQEGITNVIRHAEATQASLILIRSDSEIRLLLEDNGRGFDPSEIVPSSEHGFGLLGMQERTSQCGGAFEVESGRNKGTTVRVSIPLDRKK
jgi:signal transduction histidine kinase